MLCWREAVIVKSPQLIYYHAYVLIKSEYKETIWDKSWIKNSESNHFQLNYIESKKFFQNLCNEY